MQIFINNIGHIVEEKSSLLEALRQMGIAPENLAVAVNSAVIPREQWQSFRLNEADKLMLIRATQGG